ncbi:hypothetical protein DEMA109039_00850 [Deinococcus marmoris]
MCVRFSLLTENAQKIPIFHFGFNITQCHRQLQRLLSGSKLVCAEE